MRFTRGYSTKPFKGRVALLYRMVPHYRSSLYSGLAQRFDFSVVTSSNPPKGTNMAWIEGEEWLKRYRFIWGRSGDLYGKVSPPIRKILSDIQPELVITEGSLSTTATSDLIIHRLVYGWPKVVFWGHGWQMGRGFASLSDKISQYGRLLPYSLADGHITYCEEGASWLRSFMPKKPIHVAHNTQEFDVDDYRLEVSMSKSLNKSRPFTIIASGRFTSDKKFPKLVKIFSNFYQKFRDSRLVIIGDGPDMPKVKEQVESLPADAVTLMGAVYDEEVLQVLFENADCAAYAGSVGLAVNNALAYGLPFITYLREKRNGPFHHPEYSYVLHDKTGFRAACDKSFVSYLEKLYRDRKLLVSMRREARAFYVNQLGIDKYVEEFAAALSYHLAAGR